jgi:hypothetical protein
MTGSETTPTFARLIFECGFTEQDAFEVPLRGYRSHVWVELSDGSKHPVTFFDSVRLAQELAGEVAAGRPFVAEPGLIILQEVTRESMEHAAKILADEGFFGRVATPSLPG